jgi:hypothetical protein
MSNFLARSVLSFAVLLHVSFQIIATAFEALLTVRAVNYLLSVHSIDVSLEITRLGKPTWTFRAVMLSLVPSDMLTAAL